MEKLKQEKEEWEERSRKLMVSIATSNKVYEHFFLFRVKSVISLTKLHEEYRHEEYMYMLL